MARDIGTAQSKSRAPNILSTTFLLNRTNIPYIKNPSSPNTFTHTNIIVTK
ncbi:uncharacterized protein G2W53_021285 [Senna tora]|uniref:Uncharacterized protein n=1 Tax=Senna tora TaxID=362788 RepID=A0A834TLE4_9FABA|nr:uncharacterized protein G2W53_021285 [Senna tora]